jgi:antitoxin StbD
MTRLHTPHIATMTEMRAPHEVLERAKGHPVAIMRNSAVVAYLVPAALAHPEWADPTHPGYGSVGEMMAALASGRPTLP